MHTNGTAPAIMQARVHPYSPNCPQFAPMHNNGRAPAVLQATAHPFPPNRPQTAPMHNNGKAPAVMQATGNHSSPNRYQIEPMHTSGTAYSMQAKADHFYPNRRQTAPMNTNRAGPSTMKATAEEFSPTFYQMGLDLDRQATPRPRVHLHTYEAIQNLRELDPEASSFEPRHVIELRIEKRRIEIFLQLIHQQAAVNLTLSENLEKTKKDLHRFAKDVRDVSESLQNGLIRFPPSWTTLLQKSNEIEAAAVVNEACFKLVNEQIEAMYTCVDKHGIPTSVLLEIAGIEE